MVRSANVPYFQVENVNGGVVQGSVRDVHHSLIIEFLETDESIVPRPSARANIYAQPLTPVYTHRRPGSKIAYVTSQDRKDLFGVGETCTCRNNARALRTPNHFCFFPNE